MTTTRKKTPSKAKAKAKPRTARKVKSKAGGKTKTKSKARAKTRPRRGLRSPPSGGLRVEEVYTPCDPRELGFSSTAKVEAVSDAVGQARALDALHFGTRIDDKGFNLYVLGPPGIGRHEVVRRYLDKVSSEATAPGDWCYINNFDDPQKPRGLALPAGRGVALRSDMEQLVEDLQGTIPAAFESEDYRDRLIDIEQAFQDRNKEALEDLQKQAEKEGMGLLPTPHGFAIAPLRDGHPISEEEFDKLPEKEQDETREGINRLTERLKAHLESLPAWHKERREKVKELDRNVALFAVEALIGDLKKSYRDMEEVLAYLDAVERDVLDNVKDFRGKGAEEPQLPEELRPGKKSLLKRYEINVLVNNAGTEGAPVVYESSPSYNNLIGRLEHVSQLGALMTDFTMIRPGALHAGNGGYLVLDTERLLVQPFAWEGLKRALFGGEIRIESMAQSLSLVSTQGLEPDPMRLDLKVVLIGGRLLYYLLCEYDPDFRELFKVAADFEERIDRSPENIKIYARMLASIVRKKKLTDFSAAAVARVIEQSGRLVDDSRKLSTHMRSISDLLTESDFWARERKAKLVQAVDVQQAIDRQIFRLDRVRGDIQEAIERNLILINTDGSQVGQVNGLSVLQMGEFSFGQPSRITATVRIGEGEVVDIEREVEMGGSIHSKGVMILSSLLGARYSRDLPLSLRASLVFEQNYGGVDGDSASVAEFCVLLSALSGVPIRQSLAVTGSINQHGQVQVIGGVNEKIEGFFDVCARRGLGGDQGVVIPADNVKHLMLREDVRDGIAAGKFHVFPVVNVDEAVGLLTGIDPGRRNAEGQFPAGSVNALVEQGLRDLAEKRHAFSGKGEGDTGGDKDKAAS